MGRDSNSTNSDILSGKGLKPIPTSTSGTQQSGTATERRGEGMSGTRMDRFTKESNK